MESLQYNPFKSLKKLIESKDYVYFKRLKSSKKFSKRLIIKSLLIGLWLR